MLNKLFTRSLLVTVLLLSGMSQSLLAKDISEVAAGMLQPLTNANGVRIIQLKIPPQGELPDHSSGNRVIYTLSDLTYKRLADKQDPNVEAKTVNQGSAFWLTNTWSKGIKNVGTSEANYLAILFANKTKVPKQQTKSFCTGEQLINNQHTQVCRLKLTAPLKISLPYPTWIYTLNGHLKAVSQQQNISLKTNQQSWFAGEVLLNPDSMPVELLLASDLGEDSTIKQEAIGL